MLLIISGFFRMCCPLLFSNRMPGENRDGNSRSSHTKTRASLCLQDMPVDFIQAIEA